MKLLVPLVMSALWSLIAAMLVLYVEIQVILNLVPQLGLSGAIFCALAVSMVVLIAAFKCWATLLIAAPRFNARSLSSSRS